MIRASWYGEVVSNVVLRIVGPLIGLLIGLAGYAYAYRMLTVGDTHTAVLLIIPTTITLALSLTFFVLGNTRKAWRKALPYHFGVYPRVEEDDNDPPQRVSA